MTALEKVLKGSNAGTDATPSTLLRYACVRDFNLPYDEEACKELHKLPSYTDAQSQLFCARCWNKEL